MTLPKSDAEEVKKELIERCMRLLKEFGKDGLDSRYMDLVEDIQICTADDDLYVSIIGPPNQTEKTRVYDGFWDRHKDDRHLGFIVDLARDYVLPILRKHQVLDDLADI